MKVEKAKISDVPQIHQLIGHFAEQGQLLPRPLSELYENLHDFFVVRQGGEVLGCVALHICWSDLVELKALAVNEEWQNKGIGKALVEACLQEAKGLDVPTVFCLTYEPQFFQKFGFHQVDLMSLPRKVWGECQRCPKFPYCDETAMVLPLKEGRIRGEKLGSEYIYQGKVVSLRVDSLKLPSGRISRREIVEHAPCVGIVALDPQGNVLLVRQMREAVGKELLEIPAGKLEPGENPSKCLERELQEETGYSAGKLESLGGFYTSPGFCSEYIHLYLASELRPSGRGPNPDEISEIVRIPLKQIPELISSGKVYDAKSVAGLLRLLTKSP